LVMPEINAVRNDETKWARSRPRSRSANDRFQDHRHDDLATDLGRQQSSSRPNAVAALASCVRRSGQAALGPKRLLPTACFRQRSHEALKQKARRGALFLGVAAGYVKAGRDRIEKDPDQRVHDALKLVFSKFAEFQSVHQVHLWLRDEGIRDGSSCWKGARMLSARPGPLNPGATSPLSRHHLTCPSRAAGSLCAQHVR